MSGVKISNLPAGIVPITGTELVPVVQSGVTVKIPASAFGGGGGGGAPATFFTTPGSHTYTPSASARFLYVVLVGGGGGGGGGYGGVADTASGGGGGSGGQAIEFWLSNSPPLPEMIISVAYGGNGGLPNEQGGSNEDGTKLTIPSIAIFNAGSGFGGQAGQAFAASYGGQPAVWPDQYGAAGQSTSTGISVFNGGSGGGGGALFLVAAPFGGGYYVQAASGGGNNIKQPAGGGGGGGYNLPGSAPYGVGGSSPAFNLFADSLGGNGSDSNLADAADAWVSWPPINVVLPGLGGGGGGGTTLNFPGGNGGAGLYGGGGGGGGAFGSAGGFTHSAGSGGAGGDGFAVIYEF
jgi:hypothetical protein